MALRFRRGIDSDFKQGNLTRQFAVGEPVFNTTAGTLHVGTDSDPIVFVAGKAVTVNNITNQITQTVENNITYEGVQVADPVEVDLDTVMSLDLNAGNLFIESDLASAITTLRLDSETGTVGQSGALIITGGIGSITGYGEEFQFVDMPPTLTPPGRLDYVVTVAPETGRATVQARVSSVTQR